MQPGSFLSSSRLYWWALLLRINNWISQIIYVIQDFPADHLPDLPKLTRFLGAALHFVHFIVCYFRIRKLKDEDIGWQDMLGEINFNEELETDSWLSWVRVCLCGLCGLWLCQTIQNKTCKRLTKRFQTTPAAMILFMISIANTIYLFTRTRSYLFFHKSELSNTPSAEFIDRDDLHTTGHVTPASFSSRVVSPFLHITRTLWCVWDCVFTRSNDSSQLCSFFFYVTYPGTFW